MKGPLSYISPKKDKDEPLLDGPGGQSSSPAQQLPSSSSSICLSMCDNSFTVADQDDEYDLQNLIGFQDAVNDSADVPLLYFDMRPFPSKLLPRKIRGMNRTDVDRLNRNEIWEKYGSSMHWLTLEFEDDVMEAQFSADYTRRNKRWLEYGTLVASILGLLLGLIRWLWISGRSHLVDRPMPAFLTLWFVQYLHILVFRASVYRHFQSLLLFWGIVTATGILAFGICNPLTNYDKHYDVYKSSSGDYVSVDSAESWIMFLVAVVTVYRMRFVYFLYLNLYIFIGTECAIIYPDAQIKRHRSLFLVSTVLLLLNYFMELLQRKDFVQMAMVWQENKRSDQLLDNILPAHIISRLKDPSGSRFIADGYDQVSVFFADVVSFTTMSSLISPPVLVELLNRMFFKIDSLADKNGVEKIKTIGDCYMAATGLPPDMNPRHAHAMARFGLEVIEMMRNGDIRNPATNEPLKVRAGIHSGPCVAGVIGTRKFAHDIWGDAVNTASRMESHGSPMMIHCTEDTQRLLQNDFIFEAREKMYIKGKGEMQTYFIIDEKKTSKAKSYVGNTLRMREFSEALEEAKANLEPDELNDLIANFVLQLQPRSRQSTTEAESGWLGRLTQQVSGVTTVRRTSWQNSGGVGNKSRGTHLGTVADNSLEMSAVAKGKAVNSGHLGASSSSSRGQGQVAEEGVI